MKYDQMEPQQASVPAFGGWDDMAAAGAGPDYSLDFSKIRAARMQRRKALSWSSGAVVDSTAEQQQQSETAARGGGSEMRRCHRRQHSDDASEARLPIRAPPKEGRSKFKGYLFGCMGRWYVGQH